MDKSKQQPKKPQTQTFEEQGRKPGQNPNPQQPNRTPQQQTQQQQQQQKPNPWKK